METAALFISIIAMLHGFLVSQVLHGYQSSLKWPVCRQVFLPHYPRLRQALLASIQRHCWYLSEHLVLFALANDDIELELKSKSLDKLLVWSSWPVQDRETCPSCCLDVDSAEWSGWSTELAPFEIGRCSQRGGVEVEKRRSQLVLWHFQALCKEDCMCQWLCWR